MDSSVKIKGDQKWPPFFYSSNGRYQLKKKHQLASNPLDPDMLHLHHRSRPFSLKHYPINNRLDLTTNELRTGNPSTCWLHPKKQLSPQFALILAWQRHELKNTTLGAPVFETLKPFSAKSLAKAAASVNYIIWRATIQFFTHPPPLHQQDIKIF